VLVLIHLVIVRSANAIDRAYCHDIDLAHDADQHLLTTSVPPSLRYDVALLYLNQEEWHLDAAIDAYRDDERWEKEHPLEGSKKTKLGGSKAARTAGMRRFVGSSSSAQVGGRS
jgi:hypothetical protein